MAKTQMTAEQVSLLAALHFLVDGLCLCCLYLLAPAPGAEGLVGAFVAYNVMAFLTQPLTGLLADALRHPHWQLLAAVALLLAAVAVATVVAGGGGVGVAAFYVVALLLGAGNSLFHAWGGRQTAVSTGNDIRALGVFVSTGAFGLAVGMACCSWPLLFVMLVCVGCLSLAYIHIDSTPLAAASSLPSRRFGRAVVWACLAALMLAVTLRSFVGESLTASVPREHAGAVLLVGGIAMAGKMAGGWLARRLGIVPSLVALAVLVVACLLLRHSGVVVALAGLFLVNCTMPITLYLANVVLPGREGLAFGLLAAALMPGYLLAVLV